jgi:hypothetical protein
MFAYYGGQNQAGQLVGQGASQAAAISAEGSQNFSNQLGLAALALAKGYADRQSTAARGKAYKNFVKTVGPEIGFSPNLIKELTSRPDLEIGQMDPGLMNQAVSHGTNMRYLDAKTAAQMQVRGSGGGGGGGGGGGQPAPSGPPMLDFESLGVNPNLKFE